MLRSGVITDTWHGVTRRYNVSADIRTQVIVVDRSITFRQYIRSVLEKMRQQGPLQEEQAVLVAWHDQQYRFVLQRDDRGKLVPHNIERVPPMIEGASTSSPGIRHLMRSPHPYRTVENRIGDFVPDGKTNKRNWESYAAWVWWHGTAKFLSRVTPQTPSSTLAVEGALRSVGGESPPPSPEKPR